MNNTLKILHLEDLPSDAELVERELKKGKFHHETLVVNKRTDFEKALHEFSPQIILSDHSLPSFNSIEALKLVKGSGIDVPFILVTATVSEEFAVTVLQKGGDDYVLKSNLSRLPSAISQALERKHAKMAKEAAEQELKATNDRLLFLLENSTLGYIEWDDQFGIRSMSKKSVEIFGWTPEEFRENKMNAYDLVYVEDRPEIFATTGQFIPSQTARNEHQHRNYTKDGRVIWCEWFNSVLKNEQGKVITIMSLVQDITERKLAEENLKKTLREIEDYKYVLDESAIVAVTDQKGIILHANANFCKISKYSREELIGQDHRIINSGYHSKEFIRNQWVTIASGKVWKGEYRNRAKDGSFYWVDSTIVPLMNEEGKPYQYVSIRSDITNRKQAEEALINNELRFREFFETAPEALFVIDPVTMSFVDYNDNALKLLNYTAEELLAKSPQNVSPLLQPDGKRSLLKLLEFIRATMNGERPIFEWVINDSAGNYIFCEIRLNLLTNTARPLIRVSVLDVTERVLLKERLVEEDLKKQQEITDAVISAQERERSFLGEEMHDNINQILATSMLYMDLAISDENPRKDILINSRNYIYIAMQEIRKLSKSLLPPTLGETSLTGALEEMITQIEQADDLRFIREWKGIDETLLSEKLSLSVYRIVQEQINNIFKHAKATKVIIGLTQNKEILRLRIKDNGIGFDTAVKRNGIGLKNIISRTNLFKGEVVINSHPGEGCELLVSLKMNG
ncbi:MAG: domain S-box protein [Ferruginibacter sp.]|nr:domain S-box protein [Ferruginibacter sp.]